MMNYFKICLLMFFSSTVIVAETLYLDPVMGNDVHPGTREQPLKTLAKAAQLVNASEKEGPTIIILAPGVYAVDKSILFENKRLYTDENRLVLQAQILPDDSIWTHFSMPVLISTQIPEKWTGSDQPLWQSLVQFEVNHVTVQGIKFLGSPTPNIWYYPIYRAGKSLTDLIITQCAFVMDRAGVTSNVGVLANGHKTVIDHCIFYRCRNPVVFWRAEDGKSRDNVMRYCVIHDAYTSAIWVCDTETDLEFHHNVIDGANYVWMRDEGSARNYTLHDCLITRYQYYSGQSSENFELSLTEPEIQYHEIRVNKSGSVRLNNQEAIDGPVSRYFLHVEPGTSGSELGAGLFLQQKD